jgi:hypothetical protein
MLEFISEMPLLLVEMRALGWVFKAISSPTILSSHRKRRMQS